MRRALGTIMIVLLGMESCCAGGRSSPNGWLPWEEIRRLARSCPVSRPMPFLQKPLGVGGNYSNPQRTLFTDVPEGGKLLFTPEYHLQPGGSLRMKWGWDRVGITGTLQIEGRRLDAPAPPLRADIPPGYGDTGFQVSTLIFPTEGCWEVTGRVGAHSVTFILMMLRLPVPLLRIDAHSIPSGWEPIDSDVIFLDAPYHVRRTFRFREQLGKREGMLWVDLLYPPPFPWPPVPPGRVAQALTVQGAPARCWQSANQETVVEGPMLEGEWPARGYGYRVGQQGLGWDCLVLARIADSLSPLRVEGSTLP
ncbi:hypothetical protein [Thermoflexus sp.]|uniref:hypothetical protein n=1 Tax=Thermoflexus sp. TaxID=1969742 RepID=UPI00176475B1|nr:hypothetical protein [Thermoflexus sp.]